MTPHESQYKSKLTDSDTAVAGIASHSIVAVSQAISQPPALLRALGRRAEAGAVDDVRVYYYHSEKHMRESILRYELMGRIKPHCMFMQHTERELIQQGLADGNRKVIYYVPQLLQPVHTVLPRPYSGRYVSGDGLADGQGRLLHLWHEQ